MQAQETVNASTRLASHSIIRAGIRLASSPALSRVRLAGKLLSMVSSLPNLGSACQQQWQRFNHVPQCPPVCFSRSAQSTVTRRQYPTRVPISVQSTHTQCLASRSARTTDRELPMGVQVVTRSFRTSNHVPMPMSCICIWSTLQTELRTGYMSIQN